MGLALTIPSVSLGSGTSTVVATSILGAQPRTIDSTRPELFTETRTTLRLQQFLEALIGLSTRLDTAIELAKKDGVTLDDSIQTSQEQLHLAILEAETAVRELSESKGKNFTEKRLRARTALSSAYQAMKGAIIETNKLFISQ